MFISSFLYLVSSLVRCVFVYVCYVVISLCRCFFVSVISLFIYIVSTLCVCCVSLFMDFVMSCVRYVASVCVRCLVSSFVMYRFMSLVRAVCMYPRHVLCRSLFMYVCMYVCMCVSH